MAGDAESSLVALDNDRAADLSGSPDVDLETGDAPAGHLLDELGDFGHVGHRAADVAMKRRVAVDQRAALEDARRLFRERFREPRDQRLRHDLITDVPD